jgi:hypothetical protein
MVVARRLVTFFVLGRGRVFAAGFGLPGFSASSVAAG